MRIDVLTLCPKLVDSALSESIIGRARRNGSLELHTHDLRPFGLGKHKSVDDTPYGGGPGMVMRCEPLFEATEKILATELNQTKRILMCPQGRLLKQSLVRELAREKRLFIICGHYEGVDERVREHLATESISIGDYVLTNGALAAAVLIDAVVRLLPGVLGSEESAQQESFTDRLLDGPVYTRPPNYRGWTVPEILLSGNHGEVEKWRMNESVNRTQKVRPDLLNQPPCAG